MAKGIYKRGSVYWLRYAGVDGRIIRESTGSPRFKDAEKKLGERKQDIREGKQPEIKKIIKRVMFEELALEYASFAKRQRSYRQKESILGLLITRFGSYQLRAFGVQMLEQYQTERMGAGNKAGTINRHLATIKHMFTKAVEWEMVEEEVLKRVRKVKMLEENNRRLRYLDWEESQKLVDACPRHLRPIVVCALNTGMRRGEILGLRWDQVDLKNGFILLDKTKNGERRELPINQTLRSALEELHQGTKAKPRRLDVPYVFHDSSTGKPFQEVKRSFITACRKAGIKDFRFHDLRHCFASQLVMAGVDLTTVKELLGHKTLTMTLRYAHLAPSHKVKAVALLDAGGNPEVVDFRK